MGNGLGCRIYLGVCGLGVTDLDWVCPDCTADAGAQAAGDFDAASPTSCAAASNRSIVAVCRD
jgi:hypothetical protein